MLFQGGAEINPSVKAPFLLDTIKDEARRAEIKFLYAGQGIGRPFVAPSGMAADKVKMLRDAFDATMRDPEFIAETTKLKLELAPRDGAYLTNLIKDIYATPKPIVDKIAALIN